MKMKKKRRIQEIKLEIKWYGIRNNIAKAMLELGKLGFQFSGHGSGFGGEDFNLFNKTLYVNFCDRRKKGVVTTVTTNDESCELLFEGTIGKAMKFIQNSWENNQMRKCQRCESDRVLQISGKCSDLCSAQFKGEEGIGYTPDLDGITEYGDYVCPTICLECGQTQGKFPLPDPDLSTM